MEKAKLLLPINIGILGAAIGCLADVLLLYTSNGGYETGDYRFLLDVGFIRLILGHYLGILFIPLEVAGFWVIYQLILPIQKRLANVIWYTAVYVAFLGVTYHATIGMVGSYLHRYDSTGQAQELLQQWKWFYDPLAAILFVGFMIISSILFYIFYFKQNQWPKWMAFLNPFILYLLFGILYLIWPAGGGLLLVAGFNLSILINFFLIKKLLTTNF